MYLNTMYLTRIEMFIDFLVKIIKNISGGGQKNIIVFLTKYKIANNFLEITKPIIGNVAKKYNGLNRKLNILRKF